MFRHNLHHRLKKYFKEQQCTFLERNEYSPYNINQRYAKAAVRRCSVKKVFLEISENSQANTCVRVSEACNFIKKETLAQVFSCEFCKISKNTFSYKTPPVAASGFMLYLLATK